MHDRTLRVAGYIVDYADSLLLESGIERIMSNSAKYSNWTLEKIYIDELDRRVGKHEYIEYRNMIGDCVKGEIDVIYLEFSDYLEAHLMEFLKYAEDNNVIHAIYFRGLFKLTCTEL